MKILVVASILILAFCGVSFAQIKQIEPCPNISVFGPAGTVAPGETATFTANSDIENSGNYIYKWIVKGGNIVEENGGRKVSLGEKIEGKGKTVIKILQPPEAAGESLMVTVEINGLPDGCSNTASESMSMCIDYVSLLVDEFSISPKKIDEAKLQILAKEFQKTANSQVYVIEQFDDGTPLKAIELKNRKTVDYLKTQGVEKEFIRLLNGFSNKNLTQFYIVRSGATPPTCDSCEIIEVK